MGSHKKPREELLLSYLYRYCTFCWQDAQEIYFVGPINQGLLETDKVEWIYLPIKSLDVEK